jgi:hypothetical protein
MTRYSDADLEFVAGVAAGEDRGAAGALVRLWRAEPDRVEAYLDDDRLVRRLRAQDGTVLGLSPRLLFTILLRRIRRDLAEIPYTVERISADGRVVVFDADIAHRLMQSREIFDYLVELLVSFERVATITVRRMTPRPMVRRLSTLSIDDMRELTGLVDPTERPLVFQRIGDLSLFLTGVVPDSVAWRPTIPLRAVTGDRPSGRWRIEDYEEEGRRAYRLAADHFSSRAPDLASVLARLAEEFTVARKPLTVLAERYLAWARPHWQTLPS